MINYFLEPIKKTVGDFEDKVVSLLKKNTSEVYVEQTVYGKIKKPSKPKTHKQSQKNIIKNIGKLFKLKKEKEPIRE